MARRTLKVEGKGGKMVIPGKPGPQRKHHCPAHDVVMAPVKVFGKKGTMYSCKEGCRIGKHYTVLK